MIPLGSGIFRKGGVPGTLACLVKQRPDNDICLLSVAHVLAFQNQDPPKQGDTIYAGTDTGSLETPIADLTDWVAFRSDIGYPNVVDAAVAKLRDPGLITNEIPGIGALNLAFSYFPIGSSVLIRGAASQKVVEARVSDDNYSIRLPYRLDGIKGEDFGFDDLVACEPPFPGADMPVKGDSGAAVVNNSNQLIGLHMAGSANLSLFVPIETVFRLLDLELYTGDEEPDRASAITLRLKDETLAVDLMARTMWGEARNQGSDGITAVGCVIANRASVDPPAWWGETIEAVCKKPWQFSCWNENDPSREKLINIKEEDPIFKTCLDIAENIIKQEITDTTGGATHYHTLSISPDWASSREPIKIIGDHAFYKGIG